MRITKAMLEEDNQRLRAVNAGLKKSLEFKDEQIAWYKKCTPGGYTSAMCIAMEKISEACAHVVNDLKRR